MKEDVMDFVDCTGKVRKFRFDVEDIGPVLRVTATEVGKEYGYSFSEGGTVDQLLFLRGTLNRRIQEALSKRHIYRSKSPTGWQGWQMFTSCLEGRVDYCGEDEEVCLVIDGKKIRWDDFRAMVRGHEGFWFKLEFVNG